MNRLVFAASLVCVALSAASKAKLLEHIPVEWRPTSALRLGTTQMTAASLSIAPFTDVR